MSANDQVVNPGIELQYTPLLKIGWRTFFDHIKTSLFFSLCLLLLQVLYTTTYNAAFQSFIALVWFLFSPFATIMMYAFYFRKARGMDCTWNAYKQDFTFDVYIRIILGNLLLGLLIVIGFFFLIVPGVYFAIRWNFFCQHLIYRRIISRNGVCTDIDLAWTDSARLANGRWCSIFALSLILWAVNLLMAITIIGVLLIYPFNAWVWCEAYLVIMGQPDGMIVLQSDQGFNAGPAPAQAYGSPLLGASASQAYGAPPPANQSYAPPAQGYGAPPAQGYGAPPPQGYGAPPAAQGYGAPPAQGYGAPPAGPYGAAAAPKPYGSPPPSGYGDPPSGYGYPPPQAN